MTTSKYTYQKICVYCQEVFTAQKKTTKCCSPLCAKRNYKENVRQKMLLEANQQFRQDLQADLQKIQAREVLTMEQVALLLGVSRWTVNRYLKKGNIKTIQFGSRRLILRSELDKIFNNK